MNRSPSTSRKFLMHPAHQIIGVSGTRAVLHPYYSNDACPAGERADVAKRILLVSHSWDEDASAAAALESIVRRRSDVECERVDFNALLWSEAACRRFPADADCLVLFARGLYVFGQEAVIDAASLIEDARDDVPDGPSLEVEISAVAPWHPVLDGVGPFVARAASGRIGDIPATATCLLVGKTGDGVHPVAWAWDTPRKIFRTLLGAAEDFQRPDFLRLVLNAIEWAGS